MPKFSKSLLTKVSDKQKKEIMKIKIAAQNAEALAGLRDTKTASAIIKALPFEAIAHRWGEEIYFEMEIMNYRTAC